VGRVDEIVDKYPEEYMRHTPTILKEAADAELARAQSQPNELVDLRRKNMFIWGDAGTGKTWLAREICKPRPYMKGQNKWWCGWNQRYTAIIFNDLTTSTGFNWQTVLDAADAYPFHAEVKNGSAVVDPRYIPVVCTSNFSPEQLMENWDDERKKAFHRRYHVVHVEWMQWGRQRNLHWTFDASLGWQPPEDRWWEKAKRPGEGEHIPCFAEMERLGTIPPEEESDSN
jgi:hypothetical protein